MVDKNGTERQFDIYWEYSLGGFLYKTVIECKDYASKISIDKILKFKEKHAPLIIGYRNRIEKITLNIINQD